MGSDTHLNTGDVVRRKSQEPRATPTEFPGRHLCPGQHSFCAQAHTLGCAGCAAGFNHQSYLVIDLEGGRVRDAGSARPGQYGRPSLEKGFRQRLQERTGVTNINHRKRAH